ncbi:MAG: aldehyde dehydrogenase family protein [Pseudomonadota bacterium]
MNQQEIVRANDWSAEAFDTALGELSDQKHVWAQLPVEERIALLQATKDSLLAVADDWVETAARGKQIPVGSPLEGEEWLSGPYAVMCGLNALIDTLSQLDGKAYLERVKTRSLATGQLAVRVLPVSFKDELALPDVKAEAWMRQGVTPENLPQYAACLYDVPLSDRKGYVALVLGAGNISAIAPLDVLHKLISEHQVVILKMNPISADQADCLKSALSPLIDRGFLRIVCGDAEAGAYLCEHPLVDEVHVTGSAATHDAIVWGVGPEAEQARAAGQPRMEKRITSELGGISPTIVVPGPWSEADIKYQAEHIASQKLHNSGHNCIACQALILPKSWDKSSQLMDAVREVARAHSRPAYYPGSLDRMAAFAANAQDVVHVERPNGAPPLMIGKLGNCAWQMSQECFAPALGTKELDDPDAETYLRSAIAYANDKLSGTLGANILIHPRTLADLGQQRFEEMIAELRYGTIAVNTWCGLAFNAPTCPWGAFPGHTLEDIQSGIGTVHNALMLENIERVVIQAPWRPFPRSILSGEMTAFPRPPYFITHKTQHKLGPLLTRFQHSPSLLKLPRILMSAVFG